MAYIVESLRSQLGREWIPELYRTDVRSKRTRSFNLDVDSKENQTEIFHTLLGIELKVGKRRFSCPDLATARYLAVFARIGCTNVAVPYDITKISVVADEFETAWHHTVLLLDRETRDLTALSKKRARSLVVRTLREEIDEIGPGDVMPAFDRPTRRSKA